MKDRVKLQNNRCCGLQLKFLVGVLSIILLLGVAVIIFTYTIIYNSFDTEYHKRAVAEAYHIKDACEQYFENGNLVFLRKLFLKHKRHMQEILYISLLNCKGEEILHIGKNFPLKLKEIKCDSVLRLPYEVRYIISNGEKIHDIYMPVGEGRRLGIIHLGTKEGPFKLAVSKIVNSIILLTFVILIIGGLFSVIFVKFITRPLFMLIKVMEEVGKGNLDISMPVISGDEIGLLAEAFNKMIKDLKRLGAELVQIYNSAPSGMMVIDRNFNIISENMAMSELSGISQEDIKGRKCFDVLHGDYCHTDKCPLKQIISGKEKVDLETRKRMPSGREGCFKIMGSPFKDADGNIIGIIEIFTDITEVRNLMNEQKRLIKEEQERAKELATLNERLLENERQLKAANQQLLANEQQLRATNQQLTASEQQLRAAKERAEELARVKAEFLANMSHEIRTPMNAVLGFAELLRKTYLDDRQKEYLDTIISSGKLLLSIINDILDLSKLESGKVTLEKINFNLKYLIRDVFKIVATRIENKKIDTYIDIADNVPIYLKGDPTRLRQIFVNLLGNAIKFTKEGEIGVLVSKEEGSREEAPLLRFSVVDTGIGIPHDKLNNIFESFSQADTSITRKYGGTGLGLTICKALVEAMGGKIWVESEINKGSKFIFVIPFEKGKTISETEIYPFSYKEIKNKTVVIVEDNKVSQRILRQLCEQLGMRILSIESSAKTAFECIKRLGEDNNIPDIILCDIFLGKEYGYELVKKIRSYDKYSKIKIIAVTSDPQIGEANKAQEMGFDGYLPKPVVIDNFAKVIAAVLGDKREKGPIITRHMADELSCRGIKILVAEDSMPNRMLLQAYFEELGCMADFANNGKEAVEKLRAGNRYDLCLMDLQMPVMDGIEATKIIRSEISKDIPIIALTAAVMQEDRRKAAEVGMNDFITKPIDVNKLKEKIIQYGR